MRVDGWDIHQDLRPKNGQQSTNWKSTDSKARSDIWDDVGLGGDFKSHVDWREAYVKAGSRNFPEEIGDFGSKSWVLKPFSQSIPLKAF